MGVSASMPEPFRRFRKYTMTDVLTVLQRYNETLYGQFLLGPSEVAFLIGGDTGCATTICRDLLPVVEGNKVAALSLLTGLAAVSKPEVEDGLGQKAGLIFDCCDLQRCGALNKTELTACVVSLTRALEAMFDLQALGDLPGNQAFGFDSVQTAAVVEGLFAQFGLFDDFEAKLPRASFVTWARTVARSDHTPRAFLQTLRALADGAPAPAPASVPADVASSVSVPTPAIDAPPSSKSVVPLDVATEALFGEMQ